METEPKVVFFFNDTLRVEALLAVVLVRAGLSSDVIEALWALIIPRRGVLHVVGGLKDAPHVVSLSLSR
jgi:hypothetical protein